VSGPKYLHYRLATSAVQFTGTHTEAAHAHRGKTFDEYDADATLITRADVAQRAVALAVKHHFADSKITLDLTEDGRLTSSALDIAAGGATLLGPPASLVGDLAPVLEKISGAFLTVVPAERGQENEPFPNEDLLNRLKGSENALVSQLLRIIDRINDPDGATLGAAAWAQNDLSVLESALQMVSGQLDRLAREKAAWEAAGQAVKSCSYIVDVSDLPAGDGFDPEQLEPTGGAKKVWEDLGIMACVAEDYEAHGKRSEDDPEGEHAPFQPRAEKRLWYRQPRRVRLDVWKKTNSGSALVRTSQVVIVDKRCRHLSLPLGKSHLHGKGMVSVRIGPLGTPVSLSPDRAPGPADAAAMPGPISISTSNASGGTAWRSLDPSVTARETGARQAQREKLQLIADIAKLRGKAQI
jgi:hypothetical protein